jgi:hypothetical protein
MWTVAAIYRTVAVQKNEGVNHDNAASSVAGTVLRLPLSSAANLRSRAKRPAVLIADGDSFATPVLGCEFSVSGLIKPLQSIASTPRGVLVGVRVARLEGAYVLRDVAGQGFVIVEPLTPPRMPHSP